MRDLRRAIESQVQALIGREPGEADLEPLRGGDPGLFGPDSASWKVHGDFTSMMIGGIAALLVQMLHPGALAGVWDHSNFRQDMTGRLRRTARFISGVTYGSTEEAHGLIAKVRSVHDRVKGVTADGVAYSAHDPDLLTWVHVAEVTSFLAAYLRYGDPAFPPAEQDRYFAETAVIARLLGAKEAPTDRAGIAAYLREARPRLRADARTREVARILLAHPARSLATAPVNRLMKQAAQDLLPDWAARLHGLHVPGTRKPAIRLGVHGLGAVMRWALQNSAEIRARRRTADTRSA